MTSSTALKSALGSRIGHIRWYICGLLFFATTVNYIDRQVLGILKTVLSKEMGWSDTDFGWVVFAFQCAYALMMPIAGRLIDWLGTRLGYAAAIVVWSLASMSHAFARSAFQFAVARFALGIGEAANFPAAIKTVADWFPRKERALATGIFNSGSNIGVIAALLIVPFVAAHLGWRSSFFVTGGLDFIWLACWLALFRPPREHKRLTPAELAYIESDQGAPSRKVPYARLLREPAAWAFLIGKFLTDPVWWFYLFWLPGFLDRAFGVDLTHLGPPLIAVYLAADVGSVGGGWLATFFSKRGWTLTAARKAAMLVCAISVVSVVFVMYTGGNLWLTVALVGIAAAAHQGWSANLYTVVSDVFPPSAVGSVVGLGGLGGAVGGMLVAPAVGYWLDFSHQSYGPLFFVAGSTYLIALAIIHLLMPRLEPIEI